MNFSIIVILHNGGRYILDCIESLLLQSTDNVEVIVVDNSSTDGGPDQVTAHFPTVRLVRNAENNGFAVACNQGAALARGDVLAFLNQDTRVQPGWLAGLLSPLADDAAVGLVTSKLRYMSRPDKINLCGLDMHYSGLSFGRGTLAPSASMKTSAPVGAVSGGAFAIRRALWERLGGFDAEYFMYYEDSDLSWRAWLAGYASWYAPPSHALHDAPLKPTYHALAYSARNRPVLLLKTWKLTTLVLLAPGLLLAELVDWALMIAHGRAGLRAKASALGWVLINWRSIRARRRRAQSTRVKPDWYLLRQCSPVLKPVVMDGGVVGKALVEVVNALLRLNYWLAFTVLRIFNL